MLNNLMCIICTLIISKICILKKWAEFYKWNKMIQQRFFKIRGMGKKESHGEWSLHCHAQLGYTKIRVSGNFPAV